MTPSLASTNRSDPSLQASSSGTKAKFDNNGSTVLDYHRIVIAVGNGAALADAKTAISLLRYREEDVIAVISGDDAGKTAQEVYHAGGNIPVVRSLAEVDHPDSVFIGIAPAGGQLPPVLKAIVTDAVAAGIDVVSGLHDFLCRDPELSASAAASGSRLVDIRKNDFHKTAQAAEFRPGCLRIHAVGQDCSVGKMVAMLELQRGLLARQQDAKFLATGQTGIMIVGEGVPVDCVVSDFVNGAIEDLVLRNEDHDILLVEGQGSIIHPAFSAVTMGLLHGCAPQGLVLCYEAGRTHVKGLPHVPLASLERYRELYESLAWMRFPAEVIGVAMNSRRLSPEEARAEQEQVRERLGLPVCDVYRDGPDELVDAVLQLKGRLST